MTDEKKPDTDEVSEEALEEVSGGALSVGGPDDKYEKEADAVAEKVVQRTESSETSKPTP